MNFPKLIILPFIIITLNINAQHLSVQTGHSSTILDLEYSPDGNILASSGMDNKVILWDLRSYRQMNILSGHNSPVSCIVFHPKEHIIATASDDKTVKLWEYPSGKLLKTYDFFTKEVKSVDFKDDGTELACGSDSIYIINLKRDSYYTINKKAKRYFSTVAYSGLNRYLAFGGKKEPKVYLYSFQKFKIVKKIKTHSNEVLIDDDAKFLYSAGNNGNIKRLTITTRAAHRKFNITSERTWYSYFSIATFDKDLYAANKNGLIYVYNRKTGRLKTILKGHNGQVKAVTVSPGGKYLASAGDDKRIVIWDIKNKKIAKTLEGGTGSINSISFSENGNKMFIAYDNSDFRIWDLGKKGDIQFGSCPSPNFIEKKSRKNYFVSNTTQYLNNGKLLIKAKLKKSDKKTDNFLASNDNLLIYNSKTKSKPILLKSPKNTDYQSVLIADSSNIIIFDNRSTHSQKYSLLNHEKIREREQVFSTNVYKYNIGNITKDSKIKISAKIRKNGFKIKGDIYFKAISEDGNSLLVLIKERKNKSRCEIYDINTGENKGTINFNKQFMSAGFSSGNKFVYFTAKSDSILFYKQSNLKFISKMKGTTPVTFMLEDRYCSYTDFEKNLYLTDMIQFKEIYKVPSDHITSISSIKFNSAYNYIATSGYDGIINFWNFDDGKHLVSLAAFNEDDYMYVTKDNYYYSTVGSMDYINFMLNNKLYTFEQFDVRYNRPDIVLSKMPYSTDAEIVAYNKAYKKRLKKMGFNTNTQDTAFNIPEVSIVNIDEIPIASLNETLTLKINAKDSTYNLNRINIWVNDVPVFGIHGNEISDKKISYFTKDYEIQLSPGNNKIQVSATNNQGYESLKETFYINYEQDEKIPDLYVISIGVSEYDADEYNLEYAAKDAGDFAALFKKEKKKFNKIYITEITNKEATKENILKVKEILKNSDINDVVIVFYAGHGLLDWDMDYYVATTDIDFINPSEKGLKYDMLESLLNNIPARKKMLLIDACHSGEIDKDEDTAEANVVNSNDTDDSKRSSEELGDKKILSQSSFELMKHMFADIRKGTGSTIISSAGGSEYAYESDKTKNGIFTYILVSGISSGKADLNKDGKIMVSELRDYLMENVSKMTKGYQNPTCRRQNLEFDFRVW
ncbi:MAG: caspase family protein [Bacteroidales bacterium]|nr:caspase family protein [Bacteroidales bacterium]